MAKTASTTPPEAEKKKRTILTPTERIAKAKAEVEALEAKEKSKAQAKLDANAEALTKANAAVAKAQAKVDELTAQRTELQILAGVQPEAESTES
jgi:hypothetical protein